MDVSSAVTAIEGSLGTVNTVAVAILGVLAGIFAIRKIIQITNRG